MHLQSYIIIWMSTDVNGTNSTILDTKTFSKKYIFCHLVTINIIEFSNIQMRCLNQRYCLELLLGHEVTTYAHAIFIMNSIINVFISHGSRSIAITKTIVTPSNTSPLSACSTSFVTWWQKIQLTFFIQEIHNTRISANMSLILLHYTHFKIMRWKNRFKDYNKCQQQHILSLCDKKYKKGL